MAPPGRGTRGGRTVKTATREAIEQRILQLVKAPNAQPLDPIQLVTGLRADYPDLAIRQAIWRLLDRMEIDLTPERTLVAPEVEHVA